MNKEQAINKIKYDFKNSDDLSKNDLLKKVIDTVNLIDDDSDWYKDKHIFIQKMKGVGGISLGTYDGKVSGTRFYGSKPWGGAETIEEYDCNVEKLVSAIKNDAVDSEEFARICRKKTRLNERR